MDGPRKEATSRTNSAPRAGEPRTEIEEVRNTGRIIQGPLSLDWAGSKSEGQGAEAAATLGKLV